MARRNMLNFPIQRGGAAAASSSPPPVVHCAQHVSAAEKVLLTSRSQRMAQPHTQKAEHLHQRLTTADQEDVDPLLEQTGCTAPYIALEVRRRTSGSATERRGLDRCRH